MQANFAETIKQLRQDKKLSQQELSDMMYVDRSTIANWESGRRMPDAGMIFRLAKILNAEPSALLNVALQNTAPPNVIIVDDEPTLITGAIHILDKGHEEGGSAYANAGSSLRSPPGYSRASHDDYRHDTFNLHD